MSTAQPGGESNKFAESARIKKCRRIVAYIQMELLRMVEAWDDEMWSKVAAKATVNHPSAESKQVIMHMLRERAKADV